MAQPLAVIIMAAGQGTRMKSSLPKVVHTLGGLSLIGHALRTAKALGPQFVVPVIRHQRDVVLKEILSVLPDSLIADQDEVPGTGRAVLCALEKLFSQVTAAEGTVVVTSGDVPLLSAQTLQALVDTHESAGHAVTVVTTIVDDPSGYGRIVRDEHGRVSAIVEQKDAIAEQARIQEINAGIYAFDVEFLHQTLMGVGTDNAQGEVYLTDVLAAAAPAGHTAGALVLEDQWQAQGCNDFAQLSDLAAEFQRRLNADFMRSGVKIVDPRSTWIDIDVTIEPDTIIWPGTVLRGTTTIASHCEIGPNTTLTNATVGQGSVLPHYAGSNVILAGGTIKEPHSFDAQANA